MKKIVAALAFSFLLVGQVNAGLIFQDDFGSGGNMNTDGNFGNWTLVSGNVDLWNFGGAFAPGYSVDMNGSLALGEIQTTSLFNLTGGATYSLSFLLGNNQHSGDNGLQFGFSNGSGVLAFDVIDNVRTFLSGLQTSSTVVTFLYTPDFDVDASIFFTSTGVADYGGAIIDNVKLVPEPSTLAILALSLLGIVSCRYKKRA